MIRIQGHDQPTPAPTSVFIATPAYGGNVTVEYLGSYMRTVQALQAAGVAVTTCILSGESLVPKARNRMASTFLRGECTHLLFADADMRWRADDVIRMLRHGLPIVGGAGPAKSFQAEGFSRYCANISSEPYLPESGLVEAYHLGTGLILISRQAFDTLVGQGNVRRYLNSDEELDYEFFACTVAPDECGVMRHYSEDYSFCAAYRALGGRVWADTLCDIGHIGRHEFVAPTLHAVLLEQ